MPMYYPDLHSLQTCVKSMRRNKEEKEYKGIFPEKDSDIPEARKQLGEYFRNVWGDQVGAIEVESGAKNKKELEFHMQLHMLNVILRKA